MLSGIRDFGQDTNGNGLFEKLIVEVPLSIGAAGTYQFSAVLRDSSGNTLNASITAPLTTSSTFIDIPFDGATLNARGVNGPYQIIALNMGQVVNQTLVPIQETTTVYTTGSYLYTQFEGAALSLISGGSAAGIDTNANGKYDLLRVSLPVNARFAGFYQWSARLRR